MKKTNLSILAFSLSFALLTSVITFAKSPIPLDKVAPVEDFAAEIDAQMETITEKMASDAKFEDIKETIGQAAGVIAVMAQGVAEHPDKKKVKVQGALLRDAAFSFVKAKTADDAKKAFGGMKEAVAGDNHGEAKEDHDWAKLINMHPMMEEINGRNSKLRRVARRPKGTQEENLHIATIIALTIAMHEDTHEVKDKSKIPAWKEMCVEYIDSLSELSKAIKMKDKKKAASLYTKGNEVCEKCHEAFRD